MDKYEEALEKARAEYEKARKQGYTWLMNLLEGMFPDLKESEDERIRKALIDGVRQIRCKNGITQEQMIDWLEKQKTSEEAIRYVKENHSPDEVSDFQVAMNIAVTKAYNKGVQDTLEKQKAQQPAEWSEDWREEDIQTRFAFYTYKDDPSVLYLSNVFVEEMSRNHGFGTRILRAAEKVAETIGTTTISLKVKQNSPANAWYRKNGYGYVAFEDGYDWLEKNLEYMKPNRKI